MAAHGLGDSLECLSNIGSACASALRKAGVSGATDLCRPGSVEAAVRTREALGADAVCYNRLSALEGAIRSVRWHLILKPERDLLWRELERRSAGRGAR